MRRWVRSWSTDSSVPKIKEGQDGGPSMFFKQIPPISELFRASGDQRHAAPENREGKLQPPSGLLLLSPPSRNRITEITSPGDLPFLFFNYMHFPKAVQKLLFVHPLPASGQMEQRFVFPMSQLVPPGQFQRSLVILDRLRFSIPHAPIIAHDIKGVHQSREALISFGDFSGFVCILKGPVPLTALNIQPSQLGIGG